MDNVDKKAADDSFQVASLVKRIEILEAEAEAAEAASEAEADALAGVVWFDAEAHEPDEPADADLIEVIEKAVDAYTEADFEVRFAEADDGAFMILVAFPAADDDDDDAEATEAPVEADD